MGGYSLAIFLFLLNVDHALGSEHFISGKINSGENWEPMAYYSFLDDVGALSYKLKYTVENQCCPVLAYYNEQSWKTVHEEENAYCQSKIILADGVIPFQNVLGSNGVGNVTTECFEDNSVNIRRCSGTLRLTSTVKTGWSFVISDCNSTKGLSMYYVFNFSRGFFWEEDKGESSIFFSIHLVPFVVTLLAFAVSLYGACRLHRKKVLHRAYKLFMASLGCEFAALVFDVVYVISKRTIFPIAAVTGALQSLSELLLQILIVLIAFGWTMTKPRLRESLQIQLRLFFFVYAVIYGACFFSLATEFFHFDFELVDWLGQNIKFIGIGWRLLTCLIFVYGVYTTVKENPQKKKLYLPIAVYFSLWFITPPVSLLLSLVLNLMNLYKLHHLNFFLCLLGYCGLFYIMWPTKVNTHFPFLSRGNEVQPRSPHGVNQPPDNVQQLSTYSPNFKHIPTSFPESTF